jgi:hypothetical protein
MAKTVVARRVSPYKGEPYWLKEKPKEEMTDRVALAYYPQAGKLQVSAIFTDRETGEKRRGKTVTLDCEDLQLHPEALELLARVVEEWRQ